MRHNPNYALKTLLVLFFVVSFLPLTFAQDSDIKLYPKKFEEINAVPNSGDMFVGMRFSIVNPNAEAIDNIVVEEFNIESRTRGRMTKKDFGSHAWEHISFITLAPYEEFPYLDVVFMVAKKVLNRCYAGNEPFTIEIRLSWTNPYGLMHNKFFKWEYSNKVFNKIE